jgi:hypothetical protein
MFEALGSIPSTKKKNEREKYVEILKSVGT